MANGVRIVDNGYNKFMREVSAFDGKTLSVGIHEDVGADTHQDSELTVADIMSIHELGLGNAPERSWLRGWVDEKTREIRRELKAASRRALDPKLPHTPRGELNRLGLAFVASIKERISKGIAPPNTQATINQKGSSTPLVDSGQSISSIQHKVT